MGPGALRMLSASRSAAIALCATLAGPGALAAPQTAPAGGAAPVSAPEPDAAETRAAYERGDCAAALPGLEAAAAARPQDALPHYQLGFCLERAGEPERAAEAKRRAAALFEREASSGSSWEPFYYLAALSALEFGDAGRARAHAEEGLRRIPAPESLDGVACFRASRLAGFAGLEAERVVWMRRAAERFATDPSPPVVYAVDALISAGQSALEKGENERARDWLERAAGLSPSAQEVWVLAGLARLRLGDRAGALSDLRRVSDEPLRTEVQYAVRLLEKVEDPAGLPDRLPDGRPVAELEGDAYLEALRSGCAGKWGEQSRPAALALLMARLRRGEFLRESALAAGCIELLFR